MALPETIKAGWPEREYRWTGAWSEQTLGGRNVAWRNRRTVWYPIYRADDDGSIMCPAWLLTDTPIAAIEARGDA